MSVVLTLNDASLSIVDLHAAMQQGCQKRKGPGGTVCWGFMWTFPGNQDATLKQMSELTFIIFCYLLKVLIDPKSKRCLKKAKTTKS